MSNLSLAKAVIATAEAFEAGFDHALAAKLRARHETALKNGNDYIPNFEQCQKVTVYQAAQKVAGEYAQPVYLMLNSHWNDAMDWANETIGEHQSENKIKAEADRLAAACHNYIEELADSYMEGADETDSSYRVAKDRAYRQAKDESSIKDFEAGYKAGLQR